MKSKSKLPCYYAYSGLNYKNGFVTTCPISPARLQMIDNQLPSEFWNNEKFRQFRQELDKGKWPDACHLCEEAEREGTRSMRQDYQNRIDLREYDPKTGTMPLTGLKHVELRFSNSCNMACLHCSEVYSSNWGARLKNYVPDQLDIKHNLIQLLKTQHREGPDDTTQIRLSKADALEIANDLVVNFPNIQKIDFAGGEVLYQKQFFAVLEKLAEHPNAKNIEIFFHTNFNAKFDVVRLNELLQPFGESTIKISIDSGTNIYSYFRDGDWNVLKDNLEQFKNINSHTRLDAVCTTSIYQMLDIKNILTSLLSLNLNIVSMSVVYTPAYINPALAYRIFGKRILSDIASAVKAVKKIEKKRLKVDGYQNHRGFDKEKNKFMDIYVLLRDLERVKNYILHHKTEEKDKTAFIIYANRMDKLWKQNFNQYFKKYKLESMDIKEVV